MYNIYLRTSDLPDLSQRTSKIARMFHAQQEAEYQRRSSIASHHSSTSNFGGSRRSSATDIENTSAVEAHAHVCRLIAGKLTVSPGWTSYGAVFHGPAVQHAIQAEFARLNPQPITEEGEEEEAPPLADSDSAALTKKTPREELPGSARRLTREQKEDKAAYGPNPGGLAFPLLSMIAFVLVGWLGYIVVFQEDWSLVDLCYFAVATITTVGYGDLSPSSPHSRIFTIFYALYGVANVATCVMHIARWFVYHEHKAHVKLRRRLKNEWSGGRLGAHMKPATDSLTAAPDQGKKHMLNLAMSMNPRSKALGCVERLMLLMLPQALRDRLMRGRHGDLTDGTVTLCFRIIVAVVPMLFVLGGGFVVGAIEIYHPDTVGAGVEWTATDCIYWAHHSAVGWVRGPVSEVSDGAAVQCALYSRGHRGRVEAVA
jgi:hypothetical protein